MATIIDVNGQLSIESVIVEGGCLVTRTYSTGFETQYNREYLGTFTTIRANGDFQLVSKKRCKYSGDLPDYARILCRLPQGANNPTTETREKIQ